MKKKQKTYVVILLLAFIIFSLSACNGGSNTPDVLSGRDFGGVLATAAEEETSSTTIYSGSCLGTVVALDTENLTIAIQNLNAFGENVYLYTGGTDVRDKYGAVIAMSQIKIGDIVSGKFDKNTRRMYELSKSDLIWENRNVTNFSIDRSARTIQIGNTRYRYDSSLVIVADGEIVESPTEISDRDELYIAGIENTVYSITITKGHGYVSLENEESFIGGIVMVGSKIAQKITEDMLLIVPEGQYVLEVTKDGIGGSIPITVKKNEELSVNVAFMNEEARQMGNVSFQIEPKEAKLYINGRETDYSGLVELIYGAYRIEVAAEGYIGYSGEILIAETFQKREITLEKNDIQEETESTKETTATEETTVEETTSPTETTTGEGETTSPAETTTPASTGPTVQTPTVQEPTTSGVTMPTHSTVLSPSAPTTSASAETETTAPGPGADASQEITDYNIHIEAPQGAAVYFDGEYKGVVPVSFPKYSGQHTIILQQTGYVTKTYTLEISSDKADSHYSFGGLVPE